MQLIAVAKSDDVRSYGCEVLLKNFIDHMKLLESVREISVCLAKHQLNKNLDVTIIYADMYTPILNNYRQYTCIYMYMYNYNWYTLILNNYRQCTCIYMNNYNWYTLILNNYSQYTCINYRHPFFQDNGYSIEIGGETVILHGAVLCMLDDIPVSNFLGGFKEGIGFCSEKVP